MAQGNWSAENPFDNARRSSDRIDRQRQAKAQDRRSAGRAAGRHRRSI